MDEAKLREDALKAQVLSFEKDNSSLKEQKKSVSSMTLVMIWCVIHIHVNSFLLVSPSQLLQDAKDWQEKHEKLSEEIKVYHKRQTELENALVHKENEIDVSFCFTYLTAQQSHGGTINPRFFLP